MYIVKYTLYRKYHHEKTFDDYESAKGFFYGISRKCRGSKCTKAELICLS